MSIEQEQFINEIKNTSKRANIYHNSVSYNRVFYNGALIWQRDTGTYSVSNVTSVMERTGQNYSFYLRDDWGKEYNGKDEWDILKSNEVGASVSFKGGETGRIIDLSVSYSGYIDLTKLPDYKAIKTITVKKFSGATQTITNITGTKIYISDVNSTSGTHFHANGDHCWGLSAGVASISYKYI